MLLENHQPLPTYLVTADLPVNTKYLSTNPISRRLINNFMQTLIDLVKPLQPAAALDIGCGEALVSRQLGALWSQTILHGIDIDMELLHTALEIAPRAAFLSGSIYELPIPDYAYDFVVCTEVLEHLVDPHAALAEMARIGRRWYLLSVPHEPLWRMANMARGSYLAHWGNTPGHLNHWSTHSFVEFVEHHLEVVEVRQPFPWTMVLAQQRVKFDAPEKSGKLLPGKNHVVPLDEP